MHFDDVVRYDSKCFIRPNSPFRKALLQKWFQRGGVTRVALNDDNTVIGFGCRLIDSRGWPHFSIAPLYAESYEIAHDILRSLCMDIGEDGVISLEVW